MTATRNYPFFMRLASACVTACVVMASEYHGSVITGGLPVPGVTITAAQADKKVVTTTDERGQFAFAELADGTWTLEVEMRASETHAGSRCGAYRSTAPVLPQDFIRSGVVGYSRTNSTCVRNCAGRATEFTGWRSSGVSNASHVSAGERQPSGIHKRHHQ